MFLFLQNFHFEQEKNSMASEFLEILYFYSSLFWLEPWTELKVGILNLPAKLSWTRKEVHTAMLAPEVLGGIAQIYGIFDDCKQYACRIPMDADFFKYMDWFS